MVARGRLLVRLLQRRLRLDRQPIEVHPSPPPFQSSRVIVPPGRRA
jgi:hypothetical protein